MTSYLTAAQARMLGLDPGRTAIAQLEAATNREGIVIKATPLQPSTTGHGHAHS